MNNLTAIANAAAAAASAPEAGVAVSVLHGPDPEFSIWAMGRDGRINEHRLNAGCTDLARLTAHVEGFIANHQRAWNSDLCEAFEALRQAGMHPTWVAGEYIVANVPGIRSLPGGKTAPFTEPEIVRSLQSAHRLITACS